MRLGILYKAVKDRLAAEKAADDPAFEARLIIKKAADCTDADLIAHPDKAVSPACAETAMALLSRRLGGEPISRIFGEREFWGLPFVVTGDVLDPRPDTETLVEAALKLYPARPPARILDLGTGSGAIIVALLHEWPDTQGVATDLSGAALDIARRNAHVNGVAGRVMFYQGSWFDALPTGETFDWIVSNPPYIPNPEIETLAAEVKNHDPILALDGGFDGFDSYKVILSSLKSHLSPQGTALFEMGAGQVPDMARLAENAGLSVIRHYADLAGIARVVQIARGDK
jgi:release factor glutamine methyltransferase